MVAPVITVVGSFAVGMTIRTSHMPHLRRDAVGADFDMGPGGKGSNQAVAAARLGAHAYFAGIIGDDKLGEIATDLYAREGVDTTYLHKTHGHGHGRRLHHPQRSGRERHHPGHGGQQADGPGLCRPGRRNRFAAAAS